MAFRMGGHLATREKWLYGNAVVKMTNAYKYLGMTFTTELSVSAALSDVCKKKRKEGCDGDSEINEKIKYNRSMFIMKILRRSNHSYLGVCSRSLGITRYKTN